MNLIFPGALYRRSRRGTACFAFPAFQTGVREERGPGAPGEPGPRHVAAGPHARRELARRAGGAIRVHGSSRLEVGPRHPPRRGRPLPALLEERRSRQPGPGGFSGHGERSCNPRTIRCTILDPRVKKVS